MAEVRIDGNRVQSELDVHLILARQLDLGPYYGRNLAALRDRLLADIPRPLRLVWANSDVSKASLGADLFDKFVDIFEEVAQQDIDLNWQDRFEFELR